MLEPDDRHALLDALRPPAGFALDRAVGTTFSLDLNALLTAPVAFALLDAESAEDGSPNPTAILESIRRNANLIDVFCQAGQIALPAEYAPLLAYVEDVVHEVSASTPGRVFHPKVWVIRFRSPGGERAYRLLCLSRNLTHNRSWDTVLHLDGAPARRSRKLSAQNRPLANFVKALPGLAARKLEPVRAKAVAELAEELLSIEFELPRGFYGLRFWPLGIGRSRSWPFSVDNWTHSRLLVVSPFLSPELLGRLRAPGSRDVLVSRAETLDTLPVASLEQFEENYVFSPAASMSEGIGVRLGAEDEELAEAPEIPLEGLHAKLFVSEYHHMARLWTGSANATNAAFGGNVEFLVELQGARSACGLDAVLEGQSGGVRFRDLLESFEPSGDSPANEAQQQLERRLDEARRRIAALGFAATARQGAGEEETYELVVRACSPPDEGVLRGMRGRIWPIAIGEGVAKPLQSAFASGARFAPVSFGGLTAFFGAEIEGQSRGARASITFVVNATLSGAPANRHDRLLTSILRDRADVLRYLLLLLADDHLASIISGRAKSDGDSEGWAAWSGLPVFESMVRALARDPARLDHVGRLIESLAASEEGRVLLPEGVEAVWKPIWETRQGLRA